jgi:hypothetical protein
MQILFKTHILIHTHTILVKDKKKSNPGDKKDFILIYYFLF